MVGDTATLAQLHATINALEQEIALLRAQASRDAIAGKRMADMLRSILDDMSDGVVVIDAAGHPIHANHAASRLFGDQFDGLLSSLASAADGESPAPEIVPLAATLHGQTTDSAEMFVARLGRWITISARPLIGEDGRPGGGVAVFRDVSDARAAEIALHESEQRYALAARAANDGFWEWDLDAGRVSFSPRWKAMLGYQEHEIGPDPREWFSRVHPQDVDALEVRLAAHLKRLITHFEYEYRIRHRDGAWRWMLCRGLAMWDGSGKATRIVGSQTDVTERKTAEERLLYGALHDPLTGLANRALFTERLAHALARSQRPDMPPFAVLLLDLDRFKIINDSLGHPAGDQLLTVIAHRLQHCLRPGDTVARMGGDEFAILLEDLIEPDAASQIAERVLHELGRPFLLNGQEVFTSASIGIVLGGTADYQRPGDVLRDVDTAMYHAKLLGKARYILFDPAMHEQVMTLLQIETDLRHGINRSELRVVYQPIVALQTGEVTGFEALVRWQHPQRGLVSPDEFIPVAEETGMIIPIDRWVLRQACHQLYDWQQRCADLPPLTISVNVSARQFVEPDIVEQVDAVLRETHIDPQRLKLEITESTLVEHGEIAAALLRRLRDRGIQISIDDFGTGYSSLSYLHRLPINTIKIDRSFVASLEHQGESYEIVRTILNLAQSLGLDTVAEGAETDDQIKILRELKCDYVQGWRFALPLASDQATALVVARFGARTPEL
ncbi:MAG: EAL domain-containing protein [Chloroflexi bacterium]|nr:EAL domain-containing protein [Chloroflexota bacterium]